MTTAIVYSLAVEEDLPPVVGAAPYGVLSRQLPRLVVNRMNGSRDEGIRFFPLLGTADGTRQFFTIPDMLDPERLTTLHGMPERIPFVVDGRIGRDTLAFRVHDETNAVVLEQSVDFHPLDPLPAARRMLFELTGVLGWQGAPPELLDIEQPALSYFLVAKDDLLCLEAGFSREDDTQWIKAVEVLFEQLPEHREVQTLLLDICRYLARAHIAQESVATFLAHAADRTSSLSFAGEAAAVLDDLGQRQQADAVFERIVGEAHISEAVAVRLAGFLFRRQRFAEGRDHLERVMARGRRGTRLMSQLAVLYQHLGQEEPRRQVIDELAQRRGLPAAVGRLVCCELIEQGRIDEALAVIDGCLEASPNDAGAWLEKGRILLHAEDPTLAGPVLAEVLQHDPSPTIREEVDRLRRFVDLPTVLPALRQVDAALAGNHLERGLALAHELVGDHPGIGEAWLFLGVARQRADQRVAAIEALRHAVTLDATLGEAHNRLGILLVGEGEHQAGFDELELAIACLPHASGPRLHMAQACYFLGDVAGGKAALQEAERLGAEPQTVDAVRRAFFDDA